MQRVDLQPAQFGPHFIGSWLMNDDVLCNEIIQFFDLHPELQHQGETVRGYEPGTKMTLDITINPSDLMGLDYKIFQQYFKFLFLCHQDYTNQWSFVKLFQQLDIGQFNIQKYSIGDHFSQVHAERVSLDSSHRLLTWMTYLNDVDDGGMTSFVHYGLKVQPRKGLTLIWPAEWTHAHLGEPVICDSKYIMTGWMHLTI